MPGEMTTPPGPCWAGHTPQHGEGSAMASTSSPTSRPLCTSPLPHTQNTTETCPPAGAHGDEKDNLTKPSKPTPRLRVQGMPVLTPFPLIFLDLHSGFSCIPPSVLAPLQHRAHLTLCHHPDVRAVGNRTELQYSILGCFSYFLTFSVWPHLLLRGATAEELTLILTKPPAEAAYSP